MALGIWKGSLCLAVPAALLAGCSGPAGSPDETPSAQAGPSATVSSVSEIAPPPASAATAPPLTAGSPVSCTESIGAAKAAALVKQCLAVSPATHPPCNADNSCAMIESEIARGCALLGPDGKDETACDPAPASGAAAVAAVRRYYDAIGASDFGTAYAAWGDSGGNSHKTFEAFRAGFAHTVSTQVEPGKPGAVEGAAGSFYVTVPVTVDARLDDGTRQHFTGEYVLRQSSGAGAPSQGWHLYSAKLEGG
ncbi:hypothetical protein RXV95_14705 [Novosphingobium sp. ZN18A2]|uniref:hypothetical protein n=1 Tax=Novosphingobium sp. ZN18A2 TaxID=3079861 RepID=UPI0030D06A09